MLTSFTTKIKNILPLFLSKYLPFFSKNLKQISNLSTHINLTYLPIIINNYSICSLLGLNSISIPTILPPIFTCFINFFHCICWTLLGKVKKCLLIFFKNCFRFRTAITCLTTHTYYWILWINVLNFNNLNAIRYKMPFFKDSPPRLSNSVLVPPKYFYRLTGNLIIHIIYSCSLAPVLLSAYARCYSWVIVKLNRNNHIWS